MTWQGLAFLAGIGGLIWLYRIGRNRTRLRRAQLFADCLPLFGRYRVVQDGLHYPVLSGTYRGREVRLEPVVDNFAWRKLPVLWLKVTVLETNRHGVVLDLLMRPIGTEVYSPNDQLETRPRMPEAWPQDAILGSDRSAPPALIEQLTPHMALFDDPKMKELIVTPHGVRLVYLVDQASRPYYVIFREIRFEGGGLDSNSLRPLLDATLAIADSLAQPAQFSRVA